MGLFVVFLGWLTGFGSLGRGWPRLGLGPLLLRRRLALHRLRLRLFDRALLVWHGSGLWLFWPDLRLLRSGLLRVGSGLGSSLH